MNVKDPNVIHTRDTRDTHVVKHVNVLLVISYILVIIGALNWGIIGAFEVNPLAMLFDTMPIVLRIIYGLVGIAGLVILFSCKHWYYYTCCTRTCD